MNDVTNRQTDTNSHASYYIIKRYINKNKNKKKVLLIIISFICLLFIVLIQKQTKNQDIINDNEIKYLQKLAFLISLYTKYQSIKNFVDNDK